MDYLKDYPIDHHSLSVILHEIQIQFHHYERKYLSFKDSIPLTHIGATGLLNALESFDQNFLNIESINIKTKSQKPFTKDHITKNIDDFRIQDSIPETCRITGKEVILQLFELVNKNKHVFENLSKSEEKLFGEPYEFIVTNKPKLYIRKRYSPVGDMEEGLSEYRTPNKEYRIMKLKFQFSVFSFVSHSFLKR